MAARGPGRDEYGHLRARERRIEAIAARQHRLIAAAQLRAAGFSKRAISHRASRGRLHRIRRAVHCLHPPPLSHRQHLLAAVLACGGEAALCGLSSAALQDIGSFPSATIHVRSPTRAGRRLEGISVHRGSIDPRDLRIVDGIRCCSADLVLVDLAPVLGEAALEVVLVAAESKGLLKRGRLDELVAARRGRPGIARLARLLALEPAITKSDVEALMLPVARSAGLDRPLVNHPVPTPGQRRPLIVDCAWPRLRMVVELDSQRFHGDWERAAADRERDQLLALAGWRCHRFVRAALVGDPEGSAERLRALAAARAAEVGGRHRLRLSRSGSARGGR